MVRGRFHQYSLIIDDDDDEHLDRDFSGLDVCLTSVTLSTGSFETVSWLDHFQFLPLTFLIFPVILCLKPNHISSY